MGGRLIIGSEFKSTTQANAYTLQSKDAGTLVQMTNNVTVPTSTFSVGDAVTLYNKGVAGRTIIESSGATIRWAGTSNTGNRTLTGTRTIVQYGVATLLCVGTDEYLISGAGLT